MQQTGGDEKASVKKYFNTEGFQRWNKIYGETDEVNKVCALPPYCCQTTPTGAAAAAAMRPSAVIGG